MIIRLDRMVEGNQTNLIKNDTTLNCVKSSLRKYCFAPGLEGRPFGRSRGECPVGAPKGTKILGPGADLESPNGPGGAPG